MLERLALPVLQHLSPEEIDEQLRAAMARDTSALGVVMHRQSQRVLASLRTAGHAAESLSRPDSAAPVELRPPVAAKEDVALWWIVPYPERLRDARPIEAIIDLATDFDTSLFDQDAYRTIEVWTETELASLHALSHLANILRQVPGRSAAIEAERVARRVRQLISWHIERTQPDNATHHPWATHAFVHFGSPESLHFAETMISNCQVQSGRPDVESAWIMLDSAEALRDAHAGRRLAGT